MRGSNRVRPHSGVTALLYAVCGVVSAAACERSSRPPAAEPSSAPFPLAPQSAPALSSGSASASASVAAASAGTSPPVVRVSLEARAVDAQSRAIVLAISPPDKTLEVVRVPSTQRCAVSTSTLESAQSKVRCGGQPEPVATVTLVSGTESKVLLNRTAPGAAPEEVALPSGSRINWEPAIRGEPAGLGCTSSAPEKVIDLALALERLPPTPDRALAILRIGLKDIGVKYGTEVWPHQACSTRILARRRVEVGCGTGGSGLSVSARIVDGVLYFGTIFGDVDGHTKNPFGGVEVGCGARLKARAVRIRGPQWSPYGGPCRAACVRSRNDCEEPCYLRGVDDEGELTEKGQACTERCTTISQRCENACNAGK